MGFVDEFGRALLDLKLRSTGNVDHVEITVWIDTAFNGELVVPLSQLAGR
jgi:predicted aspartyl protease